MTPTTRSRSSATLELGRRVAERILSGANADDADTEIIQPSTLRGDQKAALWLYAWSLMDPNEQRRAARNYLELVAD